jgi:hypothetical protein
MGPRPLSAIPLSGALRDFAKKVWDRRNGIRSADDIYRMYGAVNRQNQLTYGGGSADTMYLDRLFSLGLVRGHPSVQGYESFTFASLMATRRNYMENNTPIPAGPLLDQVRPEAQQYGLTPENYLVIDMAGTFYHFMAPTPCEVTERVYLNVEANHATDIMKYVVNEIVDKVAGVYEAKIAGPGGVADRADTIVIYTVSANVSNQVVALLQAYQNRHGAASFIDHLPAMTERRLPGVSTGAEPAPVNVVRRKAMPGRQSFGSLRADLIYKALQDSKGGPEFFELIVKYFRDAGLNANDPSIQTRQRQLALEAQKNFVDDIMKRY